MNPRWRLFLLSFSIVVAIAAIVFVRMAIDSSRVRVGSPQELSAYFDEIGYSASLLRTGNASIPRITMASVSKSWADGLTVDRKKSLFFRALLPMVMIANGKISADRSRLLELRQNLSANNPISSRLLLPWLKALSRVRMALSLPRGRECAVRPVEIW